MVARESLTKLLESASGGDETAWDRLLPLVYDELRALAQKYLADERSDHTLEATALVHEAYLRMSGPGPARWEGRAQFFAACAVTFRRILVDHARRRAAAKRGAGRPRLTLQAPEEPEQLPPLDVLTLEEALQRLAQAEPKHAKVVELRFFAGMTVEQTAEFLGLSVPTTVRYWRFAKAWLYRELHR